MLIRFFIYSNCISGRGRSVVFAEKQDAAHKFLQALAHIADEHASAEKVKNMEYAGDAWYIN